jgi:hypothetical protein
MEPLILAFLDPCPKRLPALVMNVPSSRMRTFIAPTSRELLAIVLLPPFDNPG